MRRPTVYGESDRKDHILETIGGGAAWLDYDGDGWIDLLIMGGTRFSSPSGESSLQLHRNLRDSTFEEVTEASGLHRVGWASSATVGDTDNDDDQDVFVTFWGQNALYRNAGDSTFTDITGERVFEDDTVEAGLGVETRFVGWGAAIADLDNDGLPDLTYVTGSVYPEVEAKLPHYPYRTPNVVFRNLGWGRFEELIEEAGPGIAAAHSSRGAAFGDYDNDGDIDILVVNMNEPPSLLRNDYAGRGGWLQLCLRGAPGWSSRAAIGASAVLRYGDRLQARAVTAQSSFYSVDDSRLHFGLGSAERDDLTVYWPSGDEERIDGLAPGRMYVVEEGKGIVQ